MKKTILKKLAQMSIEDQKVNQSVALYVTKKLSKSDLKTYLLYLKQEVKNSTVYISTEDTLSEDLKTKFTHMFQNKNLEYSVDDTLGGGIYVKNADNIIDASIKGSVKTIVSQLKSKL